MIKNQIGENAGKIWTILDECYELTINELKLKTELSESDFQLTLGWLSRENKIQFYTINEVEKISLSAN